jgi:assimilatory nitrate reductase catalytic subunit
MCDLARRMGRGQYFQFTSARQIWDEWRNASRGSVTDYYGMTWERLDEEGGLFWPCPEPGHPGTPRLFTERFGPPDGRAKMFPIAFQPAAETPNDEFPFRLTSGRVVYQYLSGTQTRRLGFLNSQAPEPWVEIHPSAAARLGIENDEVVRVRSPRASMELKALVVPSIRPDTIFIPFHYGTRHAVNQLTNPAVDPGVKIPEYKACAATVEKLTTPLTEGGHATVNYTPEDRPKMFPYAVGETKPAAPKTY